MDPKCAPQSFAKVKFFELSRESFSVSSYKADSKKESLKLQMSKL